MQLLTLYFLTVLVAFVASFEDNSKTEKAEMPGPTEENMKMMAPMAQEDADNEVYISQSSLHSVLEHEMMLLSRVTPTQKINP